MTTWFSHLPETFECGSVCVWDAAKATLSLIKEWQTHTNKAYNNLPWSFSLYSEIYLPMRWWWSQLVFALFHTMTVPSESDEASKFSPWFQATPMTGEPWPCSCKCFCFFQTEGVEIGDSNQPLKYGKHMRWTCNLFTHVCLGRVRS